MTTQLFQNIFELRHQLHAEGGGYRHRSVNYGQGFLVRSFRKLQSVLANSLQRQRIAIEERKAIEHLGAMDDDQLRDLGITRADITRVVQYGKEAL